MNAEELRAKTTDELTDQLLALGKEQFNLRFQKSGGQISNPMRMRQVRRDVARIHTILGERQRTAGGQQKGKK